MHVRVEKSGPVTTIVMDRPDKRNAVDRAMAQELREAFLAFEADDDQRVAVLWGDNGVFCAGADLSAFSDPDRSVEIDPDGKGFGPMGPSRIPMRKPVIAAISGYAVAGGLELALMADMRVAEENATFGIFCRRWGVPLIDGGTVRLPRIIGLGRALDLILTGRPVDVGEALDIGLVNRVVGAGKCRSAAEAIAHEISKFPQRCMRADRASAYAQGGRSLEDALRQEGIVGREIIEKEGITGAEKFVNGAGRGGRFSEH